LPYDHRYRQRVYKPFFDASGTLRHASVPRRPSLWLADTWIGRWPGFFLLDELSYAMEDFGHYRTGLPTRYNSPLPIPLFDQLIWHRATLEKFPAVGHMVRRNIAAIADLATQHKFALRFVNNASEPEFDAYFDVAADSYDKGDPLIRDLWPWLTHLNEGHPNFVWDALVAGRALGLERQHSAIEKAIAKRLGTELAFADAVETGRALSGFHWGIDGGQPYLKDGGHGFLKLLIAPELRAYGKLVLTLETKNDLTSGDIFVSLFNRPCSLRDASGAQSKRFRFLCDTLHLPLPFLALFRIDVGADAHFDRTSFALPD
jgi:hypothetical protein